MNGRKGHNVQLVYCCSWAGGGLGETEVLMLSRSFFLKKVTQGFLETHG